MPSPWSASFTKIIQQLILLEGHNVTHAGQDTHIPRALLGSRGAVCPYCCVQASMQEVWLAGWDNWMWAKCDGEGNSLVWLEPLLIPICKSVSREDDQKLSPLHGTQKTRMVSPSPSLSHVYLGESSIFRAVSSAPVPRPVFAVQKIPIMPLFQNPAYSNLSQMSTRQMTILGVKVPLENGDLCLSAEQVRSAVKVKWGNGMFAGRCFNSSGSVSADSQ